MDSSLERLLRSDIYRVDSDIVVGPRTTLRPSPFGIADIRKGLDIRLIETFQGNLFFFNADHHPGLISTSSTSWIIQTYGILCLIAISTRTSKNRASRILLCCPANASNSSQSPPSSRGRGSKSCKGTDKWRAFFKVRALEGERISWSTTKLRSSPIY